MQSWCTPRRSRPRASPGRVAGADARRRPGRQGPALTDELGEQLAGWGKVVRLELRGRVSGAQLHVAVGYLEAPDGSLLVAAGEPDADWARNLDASPVATATIGERTFEVVGERVDGPEAAQAVVGLILKYGTSAERLGHGPVFRLRRTATR